MLSTLHLQYFELVGIVQGWKATDTRGLHNMYVRAQVILNDTESFVILLLELLQEGIR